MLTNSTRDRLRGLFVLIVTVMGLAFAASASAQDGLAPDTYIPTSDDGATASSDVDGLCVGCTVDDVDNVVSPRRNAPAHVSLPLGVAASARIRVELPSPEARRSRAGFVLADGSGLLDLGVLERVTVRTFSGGALTDEASGTTLLKLQVLNDDRHMMTLRTTSDYDAVEIEVAGAALALTDLDVLWAVVVRPDPLTPVIARQSEGATVATNTGGLACLGCAVSNAAMIIDNPLATAATISIPVGIGGAATATVDYGETLPSNAWTGFFLTSDANLLSLSVLGRLTISALDGSTVVDEASGGDLRVTEHKGYLFVRFRSMAPFDAVRVRVAGLVGLGIAVNVHRAVTVPVETSLASLDELAPASAPRVASAEAAPAGLTLGLPSPNPFRGATRLAVTLGEAGPVRAAAYDALGREVAVLHDGPLGAGTHALALDGAGLASGSYVVRVAGPGGAGAHRLVTVAR